MRKRKYMKSTVFEEEAKEIDKYVRWQNMGPLTLGDVEFDNDHIVREWTPLRIVSLPERFTSQCEELGQLRRVGYAAT